MIIERWVKSVGKHPNFWIPIYTIFWLSIGIVIGLLSY